MANEQVETIEAMGVEIRVVSRDRASDFISLTDIARYKSDDPSAVIANWMRGRDTVSFLGLWGALAQSRFQFPRIRGN